MKDSYECRKIDGLDERLAWLEEGKESFEDGATIFERIRFRRSDYLYRFNLSKIFIKLQLYKKYQIYEKYMKIGYLKYLIGRKVA